MESIRVILRRNGPADDDVERQQAPRAVASTALTDSPRPRQEMEQRTPSSRFIPSFPSLPSFSRPTIPSFFGGRSTASSRQPMRQPSGQPSGLSPNPRPTSSFYTDDGVESPKSPNFALGLPPMPSTRLHLPNLRRTWSQGSNGPPSRPATGLPDSGAVPPVPGPLRPHARSGSGQGVGSFHYPLVTEPLPTVLADRVRGHSSEASARSALNAPDPAESHLAQSAEEGGRRRRRRCRDRHGDRDRRRHGHHRHGHRHGLRDRHTDHHRRNRHRDENPGTPKRFLFCFPWIPSAKVRNQILKCFVSGMFLTLLLTVYLSLSITKNINNSEFTVLLILIILFTTIFFCHGLIRLCMLLVRPKRQEDEERRRIPNIESSTHAFVPGGYAIPRQPIRVVLARDEEAAGIESETSKFKPPAYGLWRESVRVDPNRIYWQRNEQASGSEEDGDGGRRRDRDVSSRGGEGDGTGARRPPSYVSDDGISYVVEAQPRSIAPTTDVPLPLHPSEQGRVGPAAGW